MVNVCPMIQQNDCTSSSFPVTIWPWVNITVIQTEIKLIVVYSIHTKSETKQLNLTQKSHQNVQLELLQPYIKFQPD